MFAGSYEVQKTKVWRSHELWLRELARPLVPGDAQRNSCGMRGAKMQAQSGGWGPRYPMR
jgi:hypothetical protein